MRKPLGVFHHTTIVVQEAPTSSGARLETLSSRLYGQFEPRVQGLNLRNIDLLTDCYDYHETAHREERVDHPDQPLRGRGSTKMPRRR